MTHEKLVDLLRKDTVSLTELKGIIGLSFQIRFERAFERVNLKTNLLCCTGNCSSCRKLEKSQPMFTVEDVETNSINDYNFRVSYGKETLLITRHAFYIRVIVQTFVLQPQ